MARTTRLFSPEVAAIVDIETAFESLNEGARQRIFTYFEDRYRTKPGSLARAAPENAAVATDQGTNGTA